MAGAVMTPEEFGVGEIAGDAHLAQSEVAIGVRAKDVASLRMSGCRVDDGPVRDLPVLLPSQAPVMGLSDP